MDNDIDPASKVFDTEMVFDGDRPDEAAPNLKDNSVTPVTSTAMPLISSDNMGVLVSLMETDLLDLETVFKQGHAPHSIFIGLQPPAQYENACREFETLMGMATMVRLFAAINQISLRKKQNRSDPFNITKPDEILAAFAQEADTTAQALTQGMLRSLYTLEGGQVQNLRPSLKRSDIHDFVLKRILGDLPQVSADTLKKVDEVLVKFVDLIKSYKLNATNDQPTLNHSVVISYIKTTDITGTGAAILVECYTRLVFLKVKAEDWDHAVQKPGFLNRNEKIDLPVEITVTDLKLDKRLYSASKPKWDQVLQMIAGDSQSIAPIVSEGGIEGFGRKTSFILPMKWYL